MARNYKFLVLLSLVLLIGPICEAAIINPVSDSHRSAALELFVPKSDGSYGSLEETYEALRTFEILGFTLGTDIKASTCKSVEDILWSPTSALKDLFQALRVNRILECELNDEAFTGIASRLKDNINEASSLHDFYYIIGSLGLIKDKSSEVDVYLGDADGVLRSIKALSQSDGRWRYSSNNPESSTYAAGMALETLAGVISLASAEIDQSLISTLKHDISKLFDGIEKYDDGAYYFDEKLVDADGYQSPLAASSSVIRGITAFASVSYETLDIPGDKILGLAKFFLGNGVPGRAKDLYYQIDALCYLQTNRFSIPLILSLPSTVLSLTKGDHLKVQVTTVLGSGAPPLSVKLMQIFSPDSTDASLIDQELNYDDESSFFTMDALPDSIDVGKYTFSFEIVLHDFEDRKLFVTGGRTKVPIYVTGIINVDQAEITVLNSDLESVENQKKLNLAGENNVVSLSANHLQKVRLSFQLTTPLGHTFKPQQAFLKLRHESKVEHIFLIGSSLKKHEIVLDFLGLVEKFYYLSGKYELQLTVGDSAMENSFLQGLGHIELDFPKSHEKTLRPPVQPVDVYTRYGPKAEISHIFRVPDKRPPTQLSFAFSGLVILPLFGFLIGLLLLRVNLKNFPSATVPGLFAIMFHLGIGAVLLLYSLFWLKFNLFQTLKALGFLGVFLMFVGHRTLSHIASTSAKLKSS